jgi:hypothetical protein
VLRASAVWQLAIAQTIVWAGLFYSFPALILRWETEFGWSKTELTGAVTLAIGLSAVFSPLAGRLIDRGLGARVLAGGALAALLIADMTELEPVAAVPDRIVSTNETAPEFTPEPYTYDAENNRHWDPGHNHWHDGPPPPIEERTVVAAAPADVEPWFYNEETDQHWDPGHDHWHKGPPPPPEDRDVSIINLEGEPVEPEASQPKPSESQPD